MSNKTKLICFISKTLGVRDNGTDSPEDFDPDKTVYDMRVERIEKGTIAILTEESDSKNFLVMINSDFYWVESGSFVFCQPS